MADDLAGVKKAAVLLLSISQDDLEIRSAARHLERLVGTAHMLLRQSGYDAASAKIKVADQARLDLIRLFKADLGIKQQSAITASPRSGSELAAPPVPAADLAGPIAEDGNTDTH